MEKNDLMYEGYVCDYVNTWMTRNSNADVETLTDIDNIKKWLIDNSSWSNDDKKFLNSLSRRELSRLAYDISDGVYNIIIDTGISALESKK